MIRFSDLSLDEPLQRALSDSGYVTPTPIQAEAVPHLLQGRDLLGCARTGTGKTAAFALPILQRLSREGQRRGVRALVLVPTRELAAQVAESFRTYGAHLRVAVGVVYGGVGQGPQVKALQRGVDVLVATPGRLVDLMQQGHARLDTVEVLVLDEADHMLDLGFIPDVRRVIAKIPAKRQTLLFSATMPSAIAELADSLLRDPVKVAVSPPASTVELVKQSVHHVSGLDKPEVLASILSQPGVESALVFTRTKRGADRVSKRLAVQGIPALAIHGNKAQAVRERALRSFREGTTRVLVATDVAARGIDVDGISHVINYELPNVPETYVHRIGRTGRAGAAGIAISLCSEDERDYLKDIEKLTKQSIPVAAPIAFTRRTTPTPTQAPRDAGRGHGERRPAQAPRRDAGPRRAVRGGLGQAPSRPRSGGGGRAPQAPSRPHADARSHAEPRRHADARSHAEPRRHAAAPQRPAEPRRHGDARSHAEPRRHADARSHAEPRRHGDPRSHAEPRRHAAAPQRPAEPRRHGGAPRDADRPRTTPPSRSGRPEERIHPKDRREAALPARLADRTPAQRRRDQGAAEGRRGPQRSQEAPPRGRGDRGAQGPRAESRPAPPSRPFRPLSGPPRLGDEAASLRRKARRRTDDGNGDT